MTTFLIMQQRIADEIVRDDLASQIKNAINDAIVTWEGERFHFNERRYLLRTVRAQEYYEIAAPTLLFNDGSALQTGEAVLELDSITITVGNSFYPLTARTMQWFDRNAVPASQYLGQPDSYAFAHGNQLRLFPVPDAVYSLNIDALGRLGPHPLVNDSDTNSWTSGVPPSALIRAQAKFMLYRDILRDADGKALASEAIEEAQWQLERKMAAKTFTGTQRAWNL